MATPEHPVTDSEHPALENPIEEHEVSGRLDKVVFGVTAALALGFVAWGFLDTDPSAGRRTARWAGRCTPWAGCSSSWPRRSWSS